MTKIIAQPCWYNLRNCTANPNLKAEAIDYAELEALSDEIFEVKQLDNSYFNKVIKVTGEVDYLYYSVGEFDLEKLFKAIKDRYIGINLHLPVFSERNITNYLNILSWDDDSAIVSIGTAKRRSMKIVPWEEIGWSKLEKKRR